ncbi:MAG TPA: hypothetical protein VGA61_14300 [Anaerolineae bacterium]
MINTLFLHPLGPSLVLALGGLLLVLLRRRGRPAAIPAARWALPLAFLFLLAAGIVLVALRGAPPPARGLLQWNWQPLAVKGSALSWRLDGWNWLAGLLVLFATAVTLALQGVPEGSSGGGPLRGQRTLWLAAAALAFVFSDNLVTLACCWVGLDLLLTIRLMPGDDEQPAGRVWSLLGVGGMLVLAALIFAGEGRAGTSLIGGGFGTPVLPLLWLAGMIRAGAYPLHFWLTGRPGRQPADEASLHLLAPLPGIWLLARLHGLAGAAWLHRPEWAALGVLALLGTALAAWAAVDAATTWRWLTINRASLVVLTAYVAGSAGPPAVIWPAITFAVGAGLLALGRTARRHLGWRFPLWLGGLVVIGFPGTPGFLARWVLVWPTDLAQGALKGTPAGVPFGLLLFLLLLVAEVLLAAALWRLGAGDDEVAAEGPAVDEPARAGRPIGAVTASPAGSVATAAPTRLAPIAAAAPAGEGAPVAALPRRGELPGPHASTAGPGPHAFRAGRVRPALPAGERELRSYGKRILLLLARGTRPAPLAAGVEPLRASALAGLSSATVVIAAAALLWGLFPGQPLALTGLTGSGLPLSLGQALAEARRSVWAGLLLAGGLGTILGWLRPRIFRGMRGWQEAILGLVSLEWLYQTAGLALGFLGSGLQYFATLGEGEGYVGWLVLAGVILWVLLRS